MKSKQNYGLRNLLLLGAAVVLIMLVISSYVWAQIPAGEKVCIHWNAAGECDDYGSKFIGIYLMPIIAAAMAGLLPLLARIEPRADNIIQSRKAYMAIGAALLLFFLALHIVLMLNILGRDINVGSYVPLLMGLMFVVIGSYMGQVRSNFFVGIRTPWTLSSELSWNKTHQLGGKLFVLQGIFIIVGVIAFTGEVWVYLLVGASLALVAVLTVYSYVIWKGDTEKQGG